MSLFWTLPVFCRSITRRPRRRRTSSQRFAAELCELRILLSAPEFQDPNTLAWDENLDIGLSVDEGAEVVGTINVRDVDNDLMMVTLNDDTGHFYSVQTAPNAYEIRVFETNPLDYEALDPTTQQCRFLSRPWTACLRRRPRQSR